MVGEPMTQQPAPFLGGRLRLGQAAFASVYADAALAVLSLAFIPYLVHTLGTEPYGILGIVSMIGGQLGILHAGVGTAATRLVAESVGNGGRGLTARLTGVAVVSAAASLLVGAVFLVVAPPAWRGGFNVSAATLHHEPAVGGEPRGDLVPEARDQVRVRTECEVRLGDVFGPRDRRSVGAAASAQVAEDSFVGGLLEGAGGHGGGFTLGRAGASLAGAEASWNAG